MYSTSIKSKLAKVSIYRRRVFMLNTPAECQEWKQFDLMSGRSSTGDTATVAVAARQQRHHRWKKAVADRRPNCSVIVTQENGLFRSVISL
jgi:hypothetical protein